jgi:hypothetical protein
VRGWLYLVAALALMAVPVAPFLPTSVVETGLGLGLMAASLMSIVAGIIFLVTWWRAAPADRRGLLMTPLVLAIVLSALVDWLADARLLPGEPDAWHLAYGLVPLVLAVAVARCSGTIRSPTVARG